MSEENPAWTLDSLKRALDQSDAFEADELTLAELGRDVLEVKLDTVGQITLLLSIGEHQILTNTLLWPRDEQDNPQAFETMMLRNHKVLLPLSALAIEQIDGRDYYELFGAMSIRSSLGSIVTEIRTIANNAIELAQDVGPNASAA